MNRSARFAQATGSPSAFRSASLPDLFCRCLLLGILFLAASAATAQPFPDFGYGPPAPNAADTVNFFDQSTGTTTSWSWNFGDGGPFSTSTAQNPTHPYPANGTYTVSLTVNGTEIVTRTLRVGGGQNSIPDFSVSPRTGTTATTFTFNDLSINASVYSWNFGDGATASVASPTHKWNTHGTYTISYTTSDPGSVTNTMTQKIVITDPPGGPNADFSFLPALPSPGQTVSFTDQSTGTPTSWAWNFGDGASSTLKNPSHAFAGSPSATVNYNVTLVATNGVGSSTPITKIVSVGRAPAAGFSFQPTNPAPGQAVTFTDTSTNSPTQWSWNFGDGSQLWTSPTPPPHIYSSAQTYTVTLTVTNAFGSNSISQNVTVGSQVVAAFTFSPASPTTGQTVSFTDTSAGSPTTWAWSFGDGATSPIKNPTHAYAAAGPYTVTLTASNALGSSSISHLVTVGCGTATTLCLNGNRFRASVSWRANGTSGVGTAVPLAADTGAFWFFSSNNLELILKVVDGRAVNNRFWVFFGGLSNVEYTITVMDSVTGTSKVYMNEAGHFSSAADTSAFAPQSRVPEGEAVSQIASDEGAGPTVSTDTRDAAVACIANTTTLCLNAARFQAQVSWRVPSTGATGTGIAVPLPAGDTGTFWFFTSNNLELMLKVVDGRAFNNRFWVFYGALSNVEYTITITDTLTGQVKTYRNESGTIASVADTSAF